ncbi:hypothetical protein EGW08_015304 [Elysia chlorotica]|uniref:WAP domain-containing protein n=1 Tax=Elysia chlorotica TaxID=188477 RepID=A0A433T5W5_ELYCH|nr:hypothetical protein EGW08_015304 [Elysia chlorotica]
MIGAFLLMLLVVVGSNLVESRGTRQDPRCIEQPLRATPTSYANIVSKLKGFRKEHVLRQPNPPAHSHVGACDIGDPILIEMNGALRDTHCGPRLHCPDATYCNTRLMDTYSTCCLSDPTGPVKDGNCPFNIYIFGRRDCFHTCNNDGDCQGTRKCCPSGCGSSCLPPQQNGK